MSDAVARRSGYAVKLVRGPFLRLPTHRDHTEDPEAWLPWARAQAADGRRLAIDLFSGAGGLSWGLERAGFTVAMGVDQDKEAVETHAHHFGGLTVAWDLGDPDVVTRIADLVREAGVELVAGGPPCQPFSKAGRSLIRHQVAIGQREAHDPRRDLWRSFLKVVALARPPAVLMENVPDMALDREMLILRTMVGELEELGYSVEERVVEAWRYGVPQFRQRLILVAVQSGHRFSWPPDALQQVTVGNAIDDLPDVEGGWRPEGGAAGWADYEGPRTTFQKSMRQSMSGAESRRVYDHITRPVRPDDAEAFEKMDSNTKYSDLPPELRRYRDDIFDDKYKRLDGNSFSRSITAHIARDGYWYIHPRQNRTLTVREAARLQTFPDHFRFAGPPSAAFRQIGNAVPPSLAEHIGTALREALDNPKTPPPLSRDVAAALSTWWLTRRYAEMALPWLLSGDRWQILSSEILLDRATPRVVRNTWPVIASLGPPEDPARDEAFEVLSEMGLSMGRAGRVEILAEIRDYLSEHPGALDDEDLDAQPIPHVTPPSKALLLLAAPLQKSDDAEVPVLVAKGVLRVAGRFMGEDVDQQNRLTAGRLAVARMIGDGPVARDAHLALIELAASVCRPVRPRCADCPLQPSCQRYGVTDDEDLAAEKLF